MFAKSSARSNITQAVESGFVESVPRLVAIYPVSTARFYQWKLSALPTDGCARRVCQNTAFCSSTQFRWKYDDLPRYFFSILLSRRNPHIRRGRDVTQIRGHLLIGCEGLLDINVDHA